MIIPRCPKCGRPMALYIDCTSGKPIVGWQCGYDNFDTLMGYKVAVTDHTETAKHYTEIGK